MLEYLANISIARLRMLASGVWFRFTLFCQSGIAFGRDGSAPWLTFAPQICGQLFLASCNDPTGVRYFEDAVPRDG